MVTTQSTTDNAFHNGLWSGRLEALALAGIYQAYVKPSLFGEEDEDVEDMYGAELEETRSLMRELKAEYDATDTLITAIQAPTSGVYKGRSAEDDDGDQDVTTELTFHKDGRITGWGVDAVDGRYSIKEGRWSTSGTSGGARVAWIESYGGFGGSHSFEVALRGTIRESDCVLLGMWASSLGVSGSVELEPEGA